MIDFDMLIPDDLRQAIRTHGFHKLAAQMYGVNEFNEKTAFELIGRKLFSRLAEQREIHAGLAALSDLSGGK